MYNDQVDQAELMAECTKYYANILTPFSPLVKKKIEQFVALDLPLEMICTSHGIIWRDNPIQIVEQYMQWAQDFQQDQITLLYDTMWNGTRTMAESIAKGLRAASKGTDVKIFNISKSDKNDIITEIFKSRAIGVGSSTINRGILTSVAGILEEIKGLKFRNKKAFAFGCYGWSGESVGIISEHLKAAGFELFNDGLKIPWNPDDEGRNQCIEYGKRVSGELNP
jgi:flavorubredoxin